MNSLRLNLFPSLAEFHSRTTPILATRSAMPTNLSEVQSDSVLDCYTNFSENYKLVKSYRKKVMELNLTSALTKAHVATSIIDECEKETTNMKLTWDEFADVDDSMIMASNTMSKYGEEVSKCFTNSITAVGRLKNNPSDRCAKEDLEYYMESIVTRCSRASERTSSANSELASFYAKAKGNPLVLQEIVDKYNDAITDKKSEIDELNKTIADIRAKIKEYNAVIIAAAVSLGVAPILSAVSFACGAAGLFVFAIFVIVSAVAVGIIIGFSAMVKEKQDELNRNLKELGEKEDDIAYLNAGITVVEDAVKCASSANTNLESMLDPWNALETDMSNLIANIKSGETAISYDDLYRNLTEASHIWSRVMINVDAMDLSKPESTIIITYDDISSEEAINALFAKLAA